MKIFFTAVLAMASLLTTAQVKTLLPGASAPAIALQNIDEKSVSFANYPEAKGFIVVFTCNTCPYSKAYEQRLIELQNTYSAQGFPLLAINPNDPEASQGDSFEQMKTHAQTSHFNFPYLYDPGQTVTKLYGAKNTPTVFVVQKTTAGNIIAYAGAIDNDTQNSNPNKTRYVEEALKAIMNGKTPSVSSTKAIGCTVKWKRG